MNDIATLRAAHRAKLQVQLQADLVPRVRRLFGVELHHQGAGDDRRAAGGRRGRIGHRLLVANPRLYVVLRVPRGAWPVARGGDRAEGGAAGADRARDRRRRRRLFDRRQSLPACVPAQRRPHLHRDGQPCVRHDQGPAVAHHRAGLGFQTRRPEGPACGFSILWSSRSPQEPTSSRALFPATRTAPRRSSRKPSAIPDSRLWRS